MKYKLETTDPLLEELESSGGKKRNQPFDQFKGIKSTYKDDIYSTALPEVTEKMRAHGEKLEK